MSHFEPKDGFTLEQLAAQVLDVAEAAGYEVEENRSESWCARYEVEGEPRRSAISTSPMHQVSARHPAV